MVLAVSLPVPSTPPRLNTTAEPSDGASTGTMTHAKVAGAIRVHVEQEALGWRYRRIVQELHLWGQRFTADFNLGVPTPVLAVERLRRDTLGQYTLGRSAIGTRTTVTMNERWIAARPFRDTLITLLHELVHAWDEWSNGRGSAKGGGHGRPWRDRITAIGVVTGPRGSTAGITPELDAYLDRYGVPRLEDLIDPEAPPEPQRAMPKWVCTCPPRGNPVRAVYLHARCLDCGADYHEQGNGQWAPD